MCVDAIKELKVSELEDLLLYVVQGKTVIKSKDIVDKMKMELDKSLMSLRKVTGDFLEKTYYGYKCSKKMLYTLKYILSDNKIESFIYYDEGSKQCYKMTMNRWGTAFYLENYSYTIIR